MPVQIFVSYAREDSRWVEEGERHELIPWLERFLEPRDVVFKFDRRILTGAKWKKWIEETIRGSDCAILLLSGDFAASKVILEMELPLIRKMMNERGLRIIPILVGRVAWELKPALSWLEDYQMTPGEREPLVTYTRDAEAWDEARATVLEAVAKAAREVIGAGGSRADSRSAVEGTAVSGFAHGPERLQPGAPLSVDWLRQAGRKLHAMVVRSQSFDPDVLIAVNQGGLVVTAAMNQSFQKPVGCLNTTIDSNSNTRVVGSLSLPHEVEHREGRYRTQRMAPRRVLVVDAKLKSGASLKAVQHILHMEYGNGVAIRYAIVLSYGGWADEKWEVLDPAFPWLARWRDRDLECYVAFYTDVDAPNEPDSHAELVRPGWTHD